MCRVARLHQTPSLNGLTVINTRPKLQCGELSAELRGRGAVVLELPALVITLLPIESFRSALLSVGPADILAISSRNSCLALKSALLDDRELKCALQRAKTVCVGLASAELARAIGLSAHVVSSEANWEGLAETIITQSAEVRPRVVALRGSSSGRGFSQVLRDYGFLVEEVTVYRSEARGFSDSEIATLKVLLAQERHVLLVFSSPLGVKSFGSQSRVCFNAKEYEALCRVPVVVLGRKAADAAAEMGFAVAATVDPSNTGTLVEAIESSYKLFA